MIPVVYTKAMRSFIRYRQLHLSPSQFLEEDVFSSEIEVKTEKKGACAPLSCRSGVNRRRALRVGRTIFSPEALTYGELCIDRAALL